MEVAICRAFRSFSVFFRGFRHVDYHLATVSRREFIRLSHGVRLSSRPVFLRVVPFFVPVVVGSSLTGDGSLFFLWCFFRSDRVLFVRYASFIQVCAC